MFSTSDVTIPTPPSLQGLSTNHNANCRYNRDIHVKSTTRSTDCDWASRLPEVQRACTLAQVCLTNKPKYCRIKTDIKAITQNGPTCGLTALNMLSGGLTSTDDILALAKRKKFTNHGEMFCTRNLKELAAHVFASINYPATMTIYSGTLNCDRIKAELRNGACIFVAYDSDFNHAPCLKNGHKAHWALVIGCLIDDSDRFYAFARHGKTKNLAVWPLDALSNSNSNLNEYTAPHRYDEYSFRMPIDGIAGEDGLKNQCIIVNGIKHDADFIYAL